jgi:putative addiction module component (TIGR02574 family)
MTQLLRSEIAKMSVAEKVLLVESLWDDIAQTDQDMSLSDEIKNELDRRYEQFLTNPREGSHWHDVKRAIITGS